LRVDIAEGADLRRIDFPLMFVTTGRTYWNEYQSADEDWNNPEFIDILVAAPVDRFMGIVSGSPVLAPAFMMGDLSEIGYNATTYDMILNVSSAVMYYNISVFPSCTVNGSSESRAFDDMAYSSSGPF